jgi:hypothetical protein
MRMMIELGVLEPARRYIRWRDLRQVATAGLQDVTLLAGFGPQQPFRIFGAELNPLRGIPRDLWDTNPRRQLPVGRFDLMNCRWIACYVLGKGLRKKSMHCFRLVMRDLLVSETWIELERVAGGAMTGEADWRHVAGMPVKGRAGYWLRDCAADHVRAVGPVLTLRSRAMAIITPHLHALSVRSDEFRQQVQVVIEPDFARITRTLCKHRKFGMTAIKAGDRNGIVGLAVSGLEMSVALRAVFF